MKPTYAFEIYKAGHGFVVMLEATSERAAIRLAIKMYGPGEYRANMA
jgi:hypothetical protein